MFDQFRQTSDEIKPMFEREVCDRVLAIIEKQLALIEAMTTTVVVIPAKDRE